MERALRLVAVAMALLTAASAAAESYPAHVNELNLSSPLDDEDAAFHESLPVGRGAAPRTEVPEPSAELRKLASRPPRGQSAVDVAPATEAYRADAAPSSFAMAIAGASGGSAGPIPLAAAALSVSIPVPTEDPSGFTATFGNGDGASQQNGPVLASQAGNGGTAGNGGGGENKGKGGKEKAEKAGAGKGKGGAGEKGGGKGGGGC